MSEAGAIEEIPPKVEMQNEFKKPILVGRIGKLPKKAKTEIELRNSQESQPQNANDSSEISQTEKGKSDLAPAILLKELSTPIPYKEPKWSGLCPDG